MQNKKMTNPTDGINESNKKLRAIYDQLCCLTGAVNDIDINVGDIELEVDGVEELLQDILDAIVAGGGGGASYNSMDSVAVTPPASFVFAIGQIHSFAWELTSGASVQISTPATTTTFTSSGSISFSTVNAQPITITAIGATVNIIYNF